MDRAVSCAPYGAIAVSSLEYGAMVDSWVEYGAMVVRSAAYGATVVSCGPTAMTPSMAAELAPIVVSTASPLAPPPAAAMTCPCRVLLVGAASSLANRAGLASITASSGANFCAFASWTLYLVAVAITAGGILPAVAVTVGGILAAVASTAGGTFCASATIAGWLVANASVVPYWAA